MTDKIVQAYDKVVCANWDSFHPQPLYRNGQCIGILQPRATQAELGFGIQRWSRPVVETRTD